jgi:hypothetical protein
MELGACVHVIEEDSLATPHAPKALDDAIDRDNDDARRSLGKPSGPPLDPESTHRMSNW